MRALGIDPGLVRTGWAVVEPVGLRATVLAHGIIAPPTHAELPARLADGARHLREVLTRYRPDFVALEEVFTAVTGRHLDGADATGEGRLRDVRSQRRVARRLG